MALRVFPGCLVALCGEWSPLVAFPRQESRDAAPSHPRWLRGPGRFVPSRNSRRPEFPGMLRRSVSRRLGPGRVSRGSPVYPGPLPVVLPGSHEEELLDRTAASRGSRRIPLHPAPSRCIPVFPLFPGVSVLREHPCTPRDLDASRTPGHPISSQGSRCSRSIPALQRDPVPLHPSVPSAFQCSFCSQNSQCSWSIPLMDPHAPSASQCSQ